MASDRDVVEEEERILNRNEIYNDNVRISKLYKVYASGFGAVNGVTFGVKNNEIIGLLGPNGAGKSSTFNMLSTDLQRSYGDIKLN